MEGHLDECCAVGRHSGRWAGVIEGHSAEEEVANNRHIVAAVEEEAAGMNRRTVVAAEDHRNFRTEAEESWSNRRILAEVGDIAEEDSLRTAAGEALDCSLPGYGSLDRDSTTFA